MYALIKEINKKEFVTVIAREYQFKVIKKGLNHKKSHNFYEIVS